MNQPRHSTMELTDTDNIVIVGGSAGGLELACKLGRKFGPQRVTLVERTFYHVWKPSLHEVAAGTVDMHQEALAYTMLAHRNRFKFVYGAFTRVDVVRKTIVVAAVEEGAGELVIPERILPFSRLCIAVGGTANYFDSPGAAQYSMSLNGTADAEAFRMEMLKKMTWAQHRKGQDRGRYFNLVICRGRGDRGRTGGRTARCEQALHRLRAAPARPRKGCSHYADRRRRAHPSAAARTDLGGGRQHARRAGGHRSAGVPRGAGERAFGARFLWPRLPLRYLCLGGRHPGAAFPGNARVTFRNRRDVLEITATKGVA
jgi:hypothetical protein